MDFLLWWLRTMKRLWCTDNICRVSISVCWNSPRRKNIRIFFKLLSLLSPVFFKKTFGTLLRQSARLMPVVRVWSLSGSFSNWRMAKDCSETRRCSREPQECCVLVQKVWIGLENGAVLGNVIDLVNSFHVGITDLVAKISAYYNNCLFCLYEKINVRYFFNRFHISQDRSVLIIIVPLQRVRFEIYDYLSWSKYFFLIYSWGWSYLTPCRLFWFSFHLVFLNYFSED